MQPQQQMYPVRQDPGPHLDRLTAPQRQGPMTQDRLMRETIQDADSILSQIRMMKMLEVPFSYGFLANKVMQECPLGSKRHLRQPICLLPMCPSGFTAKQVCGQQRDDGLLYAVDSPFCNTSATTTVRQSKSPEDREIGRRFKPLWEVLAPKLQEIFPDKDAQPFMYEHKSSAYTIAETELENRSLVLPHLDTLLVCVRLKPLMMCYNKVSVMQAIRLIIARQCVVAASSPVRPLAGRGLFLLCGFPLCRLLHVAFRLGRRQPLHEHVPFCCEVNQTQCNRPYGTATFFLQTAIWLGTCQSIMTQTERSNEPALVCPFQSRDLLARGTHVPRVAVGSTRRTRSA